MCVKTLCILGVIDGHLDHTQLKGIVLRNSLGKKKPETLRLCPLIIDFNGTLLTGWR